MKITDSVVYVGVNDHDLDLFEGQYSVPNGMSYNSYIIIDEKTAVMDAVDKTKIDEWLSNIKAVLGNKAPDYLVVQHMEPDHSAGILAFAETYPNAQIVSNATSFTMMNNFFGTNFAGRSIAVKEGSELELGSHVLTFIAAPMIHWPEVIMTYDKTDRILFSADAFGKFGALDVEEEWDCEARRYYFGIVGKYGPQVQAVLKKAAGFDISVICPLHGPVLTENLSHHIGLYDTWSSYKAETEGVFIACASIYGHTMKVAELLAKKLTDKGVRVELADLAREDMAECVENAFRYSKTVFAASSYNAGVFPFMHHLLHALNERGFKNRTVALMENGSWAPTAAKVMAKELEGAKDLTVLSPVITVKGSSFDEAQLDALVEELVK